MTFALAALLTSVTVTVTSPHPTASSGLGMLPIESNIVQYTNAQRARHGLPPLQVDATLMGSARRHAIWMARMDRCNIRPPLWRRILPPDRAPRKKQWRIG